MNYYYHPRILIPLRDPPLRNHTEFESSLEFQSIIISTGWPSWNAGICCSLQRSEHRLLPPDVLHGSAAYTAAILKHRLTASPFSLFTLKIAVPFFKCFKHKCELSVRSGMSSWWSCFLKQRCTKESPVCARQARLSAALFECKAAMQNDKERYSSVFPLNRWVSTEGHVGRW